MTYRTAKIIGTGSYAPTTIRSNEELSTLNGVSALWPIDKLGIATRHIACPGELTSDLAMKAARQAINASNLLDEDIDLLILATATPDRQAPSTAAIVQDKLGLSSCVSFDISAVCSGFLYGLSIARTFISNGDYRNVLVVGSDRFSTITDWNRRDSFFFGDGAGAVVLSCDDGRNDIFEFELASKLGSLDYFTVPSGEKSFQMDGPAVFRSAVDLVSNAVTKLLDRTGISHSEIKHVIPHQPSVHLLKTISDEIGITFSKFHCNMDRYANTAGATIPLVLDEAVRSRRLTKGELILFIAAGAGMSGGAAITSF